MIYERSLALTETGLGADSSRRMTGVSVRKLARTPEPPAPKDAQLYLIAAGAALAYSLFCPWTDARELKLGALLVVFVSLYFSIRAFRWNRTVYQRQFERWECTWKCLTCGFAFVPPSLLASEDDSLASFVLLDTPGRIAERVNRFETTYSKFRETGASDRTGRGQPERKPK